MALLLWENVTIILDAGGNDKSVYDAGDEVGKRLD